MSQSGSYYDGSAETGVEKFQGNSGGLVGPDENFTVNIIGNAPISVAGVPGTHALVIEFDGTVPLIFEGNGGGIAVPVDTRVLIVGDNSLGINTVASTNEVEIKGILADTTQIGVSRFATVAETIIGTVTNATVTPSGLANKLGSQTQYGVPYSSGSTLTLEWTDALSDGEFLIGDTGAEPKKGSLTSTGSSLTITNGPGTIDLDVAGSFSNQFDGDIGSTTAVSGVLTLEGGNNITTSAGSPAGTVTIDLNSTIDITSAQIGFIDISTGVISNVVTNGSITLSPDGNGVLNVTASPILPTTDRLDSLGSTLQAWDNVYCDGITFDDGTNILEDYVAPTTFTPELTFGLGNTGLTTSTNDATYERVGNMVFFRLFTFLSSKGTSTGTARIGNLPITPINLRNILTPYTSNITFSGYVSLIADAANDAFTFRSIVSGGGAVDITNTGFTDSSFFVITGTYGVS